MLEMIRVRKPFKAIIVERTTDEGMKLYLHDDGWFRLKPTLKPTTKSKYGGGYFKNLRHVEKALVLTAALINPDPPLDSKNLSQ